MASRISRLEAMTTMKAPAQTAKGWLCNCSDCSFATKSTPNYPDRTYCWGCLRPKAQAMKPPDHARIVTRPLRSAARSPQSADADGPTEKEAKKREARARKRQAKAAFKAARAGGAGAEARAETEPPPTPAVSQSGPIALAMAKTFESDGPPRTPSKAVMVFPKEVLDLIPLISGEATREIRESMAHEHAPQEAEARTPEETLARTVGEKGAAAKMSRRSELEADIRRFNAVLLAMADSGESMNELKRSAKDQLKAAEASLAKVMRDAPTTDHGLLALAEARSSYEVAMQVRKDRAAKGATKAGERTAMRHAQIAKLREQITTLEDALVVLESDNNDKYIKKAREADEMDKKVLELIDRKVAELTPDPSPPAQCSNQPPSFTGALALAMPPDTATPTIAQLQEAEKKIAELTALLQAGAHRVHAEFNAAFEDIEMAHLPAPKVPPKEILPAFGTVYESLTSWQAAGAATAFEWKALNSSTGEVIEPIALGKQLLGRVWDRWYGDKPPVGTSVVPRQVVLLMQWCLGQIKHEFEAAEVRQNIATRASGGFEAVKASAKRLRLE